MISNSLKLAWGALLYLYYKKGLFDLTPGEARVAEAIASGIGTREVAAKSGVSDHTIRAQLRAIFLKTGTSKQAELAALLNGISFDI